MMPASITSLKGDLTMPVKKRSPDPLESEIVQAVDAVFAIPDAGDWESKLKLWTRRIKTAISRLGSTKNYYVCASGCDSTHCGEWLYDLCWLSYKGEILQGAPMAMEIEWEDRSTDVDDDFQKLVLARCDLRVMLLRPRDRNQTLAAVELLLGHISECRHSCVGDKYLFGCWNDRSTKFNWFPYEVS
jgi:hypothetical protein